MKVTPPRSPPVNVPRDAEPFFQPTLSSVGNTSPKRTGPDNSTAQQLSAGKLISDSSTSSSSSKRTGPDSTATKQKSTGKLKGDQTRPTPSTGHTGPDTATLKSKLTGKPHADPHRPSNRPTQTAITSPTDPPLSDRHSKGRPQPATTDPGSPSLRKS